MAFFAEAQQAKASQTYEPKTYKPYNLNLSYVKVESISK